MVEFLVGKGADSGHNGNTPLHVAAESGREEVTRVLVQAGAQNTPNDTGYTPAILACGYGHHRIMELLHAKFPPSSKEQYDRHCLLVNENVLDASIGSVLHKKR